MMPTAPQTDYQQRECSAQYALDLDDPSNPGLIEGRPYTQSGARLEHPVEYDPNV